MPKTNTFENVSSGIKSRLNYFLEKLYIFSKVKDTKAKTNEILTEAETMAQIEMVKQTLEARQNKLDKELKPQNDIRQTKDLTRQGLYKTLANKKSKDNGFAK